jgi:Holliday junction DNA helicase RuvA
MPLSPVEIPEYGTEFENIKNNYICNHFLHWNKNPLNYQLKYIPGDLMIERVVGQILEKAPTFCVVNCGGVGIGIYISIHTYQKLAGVNQTAQLLTHLHVREDLLQLFGFMEEQERDLFRKLINVSGIGPRMAITILSGMTIDELIQAISVEDFQMLTQIPGIGRKTAQRLVLELKEKVDLARVVGSVKMTPTLATRETQKKDEAILALTTLGYKNPEAKIAVEKILRQYSEDLALEEIVKLALREVK